MKTLARIIVGSIILIAVPFGIIYEAICVGIYGGKKIVNDLPKKDKTP